MISVKDTCKSLLSKFIANRHIIFYYVWNTIRVSECVSPWKNYCFLFLAGE